MDAQSDTAPLMQLLRGLHVGHVNEDSETRFATKGAVLERYYHALVRGSASWRVESTKLERVFFFRMLRSVGATVSQMYA